MSNPPTPNDLPVAWIDLDEMPVLFANQIVVQFQRNEFVIGIGQANPPALVGTPEQVADQARQIEFVPVRPIVRLGMNRERLVEFVSALQACLQNHDDTMARIDPTHPGH